MVRNSRCRRQTGGGMRGCSWQGALRSRRWCGVSGVYFGSDVSSRDLGWECIIRIEVAWSQLKELSFIEESCLSKPQMLLETFECLVYSNATRTSRPLCISFHTSTVRLTISHACSRTLQRSLKFPLNCKKTQSDVAPGFPFSFGIFQEYYSTHTPFSTSPTGIPIIGTTATGIMYLSGPFMFAGLQYWPKFRRRCPGFGLAIITISLIASSFATQVVHLIVTQGVLYAVGGTLLYCPVVSFLDEWFVRKKGMGEFSYWQW